MWPTQASRRRGTRFVMIDNSCCGRWKRETAQFLNWTWACWGNCLGIPPWECKTATSSWWDYWTRCMSENQPRLSSRQINSLKYFKDWDFYIVFKAILEHVIVFYLNPPNCHKINWYITSGTPFDDGGRELCNTEAMSYLSGYFFEWVSYLQ